MFKSPRIMPLFALCAGVALLTLEWRNGEGLGFWAVFAAALIVFAAVGLALAKPAGAEDERPPL